jgi:hypothetical protein
VKTCLKCGVALSEEPTGGRPPSYCSAACRRAAEFELRRLQRAIESAEKERDRCQRKVDGVQPHYGNPDRPAHELAWWTRRVATLEARLRELLADGSVKVSPS